MDVSLNPEGPEGPEGPKDPLAQVRGSDLISVV